MMGDDDDYYDDQEGQDNSLADEDYLRQQAAQRRAIEEQRIQWQKDKCRETLLKLVSPILRVSTPAELRKLKFQEERSRLILERVEKAKEWLRKDRVEDVFIDRATEEILRQAEGAPSDDEFIVVDETYQYPDYNFLIQDWGLCPGPPALLCAYGFSGKTILGQYLAVCIATGTKLFDTYEVAQGPVVHLDYEQGRVESKIRYARLIRGLGLRLPPEAILYTRPKFMLDDLDAEDRLTQLMTGRRLILVDSLRAGITGDENDSSSREAIDRLGMVSEKTGCTALILAHSGKSEKADGKFKARGTSAFYDAAGSFFDLDKDDDRFVLRAHKGRAAEFKGLSYTLHDVGDLVPSINKTVGLRFQFAGAVQLQPEISMRDRIVGALKQGPLGAGELRTAVGGNEQEFGKVKNELLDTQIIERKQEVREPSSA